MTQLRGAGGRGSRSARHRRRSPVAPPPARLRGSPRTGAAVPPRPTCARSTCNSRSDRTGWARRRVWVFAAARGDGTKPPAVRHVESWQRDRRYDRCHVPAGTAVAPAVRTRRRNRRLKSPSRHPKTQLEVTSRRSVELAGRGPRSPTRTRDLTTVPSSCAYTRRMSGHGRCDLGKRMRASRCHYEPGFDLGSLNSPAAATRSRLGRPERLPHRAPWVPVFRSVSYLNASVSTRRSRTRPHWRVDEGHVRSLPRKAEMHRDPSVRSGPLGSGTGRYVARVRIWRPGAIVASRATQPKLAQSPDRAAVSATPSVQRRRWCRHW